MFWRWDSGRGCPVLGAFSAICRAQLNKNLALMSESIVPSTKPALHTQTAPL